MPIEAIIIIAWLIAGSFNYAVSATDLSTCQGVRPGFIPWLAAACGLTFLPLSIERFITQRCVRRNLGWW